MSEDGGMSAEAEARYEEALAEREVEDVRPLYRELLRRLRDADPVGYDEAVERYREELLVRVEESEDPLRDWVEYGRWLADRTLPGDAVAIDGSGKARELGKRSPPAEALLIHLPESGRDRAVPLAVPREPTEAQATTRELLCG